ncbi:hypothetical protein IGI04_030877 [Brassica rapa subsp. trilocularis]|uniref:Uncharacterized protein n=1 Tax=Brassica rapa subsp. trilocularis TaxID=1813537 RepID=A0ABQ7LUD9_BRACM|nr:hypothetical protein IGI04_030877 [Brassica rapa subsp. trilocularis]
MSGIQDQILEELKDTKWLPRQDPYVFLEHNDTLTSYRHALNPPSRQVGTFVGSVAERNLVKQQWSISSILHIRSFRFCIYAI